MELPVKGIEFLMGNDVVGNKVTPVLELDSSDRDIQAVKDENNEFPLCGSVLFGLSEGD